MRYINTKHVYRHDLSHKGEKLVKLVGGLTGDTGTLVYYPLNELVGLYVEVST